MSLIPTKEKTQSVLRACVIFFQATAIPEKIVTLIEAD
jgi:hypothetical protein